MSSHISRIAERYATYPGCGNRASAPFFLAMAGFALKAAIAWLDRAERDRPEMGHGSTADAVRMLADRTEALERRARHLTPPPAHEPEAIEMSA